MASIKPGQILSFEHSLIVEISNNKSTITQEINSFLHEFTYSCQSCGDTAGLYPMAKVLSESEVDDKFRLVVYCSVCEKRRYQSQLKQVRLAIAAELGSYLDQNKVSHNSQFVFSHPYFQESTDYMLAVDSESIPDIIKYRQKLNCAVCGKLDVLEHGTHFEQWGDRKVIVLKFTCKNCLTNLIDAVNTERLDSKLGDYLRGRVHGAILANLQ